MPSVQRDPLRYPRIPLVDARIRGLKPKERPYKTAEFAVLYILTQPTGARLWRFKYRFDGKEKLMAIGCYPEVSLAQARKLGEKARADVAAGVDPNAAKQEAKRLRHESAEYSFCRLADAFLEKAREAGRAASTQAKNEWLLDMAKAEFGRKPLAEVTVPMILACLRKVEARGDQCDRHRERARLPLCAFRSFGNEAYPMWAKCNAGWFDTFCAFADAMSGARSTEREGKSR